MPSRTLRIIERETIRMRFPRTTAYSSFARVASVLVVCTLLANSAIAQYASRYDDNQEPPDYPTAYVEHVNQTISSLTTDIGKSRAILNERGAELLDEIALRLDDAMAALPGATIRSFRDEPPPLPRNIQRLNEFERVLAEEVYEIDVVIDDDLIRMETLRDSLELGLKQPAAALAIARELEKGVRTNLDLWTTKVDVVRQRLIRDGTADQARRMFAREYNAITAHYSRGAFSVALARLDVLTAPYGDFPLPEWTESLPFYRAEIYYALGQWNDAYTFYERTWKEQSNTYAAPALLNWMELAFTSGKYRQIATVWVTNPRLPDDVITANRMRLLAAESYIRLGDTSTALTLFNRLETPSVDSSLDYYTASLRENAQRRLSLYAQLLRAEARADAAFSRKSAPADAYAPTVGFAESEEAVVDSALLSELDVALTGLGEVQRHVSTDAGDRLSYLSYQIASGEVEPPQKSYAELDAIITDIEKLVPQVRRFESEGPLTARVLMALGHLYFQRGRFGDSAAAFAAVPISSAWYPKAQVSRAWAEMELGKDLQAMSSLAIAQRYQLSPSLALEAAALNAFLLQNLGQIEQADDQLRRMVMAVSIESRRTLSTRIANELRGFESGLRLVGVIALEKQQESLYRDALRQRIVLDSLSSVTRQVENHLRRYAANQLSPENVEPVRALIRKERDMFRQVQTETTALRRRAGRTPASLAIPDVTYDQRRDQLQSWLAGFRPEDQAQQDVLYHQWSDYAEFAYAKQLFEENLRRKTRSQQLKEERARISRLLQETP